ncbi:hypothetical protein D9M71_661870 [compost metagenome]
MYLLEGESATKDCQENDEPPLLKRFGEVDHHLGKGRQFGAKASEYDLELWYHLYQQNRRDDQRHHQYRNRVGHRLFYLGFQCLGLFLVGGDTVQ